MNHIKNETNINFFSNNKVKIRDELVFLINTLNSIIKSYYIITKQILIKSKENIQNKNLLEHIDYINNIENQLHIFIQNAKEIFSKMKYVKKQSSINEQKNKNQLYNYCNNNFYYYSNIPAYSNIQNFNDILPQNCYQKISFKTPNTNSKFNINNIKYNNSLNRYIINGNSPNNLIKENKNIINRNINELNNNYSLNGLNKNKMVPLNLNFKKILNKEDLLKNILFLLKQIKLFKGKIFCQTNDAKKCKNIFYLILEELDKLIEILTNEKNKEFKSLSARNIQKTELNYNIINQQKDLIKSINIKRNTISINSPNNINSRNIINNLENQIKSSKSQNINLKIDCQAIEEDNRILENKYNKSIEKKNKEKEKLENNNIKGKSNDISLRNILFKNNQNKTSKIFIEKGQQTEKINNYNISKEKELFIENNNNDKIIEKDNIIKKLEEENKTMKNNMISLKQELSNSNDQLSFFKKDNNKQNRQINDMSREITLLKKLIENKDKEQELLFNKKDRKDNFSLKQIKNESNIDINQYEELETDRDKIIIKYELLKLEYDKLKKDIEEKDKLINSYSLYSNLNNSQNKDQQILNLIKKHKNEIDELTEKYTKDIINLKINLPNCFSEKTHEILIDKKYEKYNLHWYLLTVIPAKEKDYENTFWVSEKEIKGSLDKFNKFKNEEEIEKENLQDYFIAQQKLIKKIEINEYNIDKLEAELKKYKNKINP